MADTTTSPKAVETLINTPELWEMVLLHQSINDLIRLRRLSKATIKTIRSSSKSCKKLFFPHSSLQPVHPHSHPGKFLLIRKREWSGAVEVDDMGLHLLFNPILASQTYPRVYFNHRKDSLMFSDSLTLKTHLQPFKSFPAPIDCKRRSGGAGGHNIFTIPYEGGDQGIAGNNVCRGMLLTMPPVTKLHIAVRLMNPLDGRLNRPWVGRDFTLLSVVNPKDITFADVFDRLCTVVSTTDSGRVQCQISFKDGLGKNDDAGFFLNEHQMVDAEGYEKPVIWDPNELWFKDGKML